MEPSEGVHLLVAGYIRCNSLNNIPIDIINLCLKWYYEPKDYWNRDEMDESVSVDTKQQTATGKYSTIVGSIIISKNTDIKVWKVKCLKLDKLQQSSFLTIGIIPTNQNHLDAQEAFNSELYNFGYGLDLYNGRAICRLSQPQISNDLYPRMYAKQGDVITVEYKTIIVDDNNENCYGQLNIRFNEKKMKKAFDDIPIKDGEKYRFGVSFYVEETVQLLQ